MTVAEIVILIVGAALFTISFFIPDKSGDRTEDIESLLSSDAARDAITGALDGEISRAKDDLRDALEEQLTDNKDRLDRYMDRITNEKMMAVSEYSDTVLQQIHKDHEEAVFLYDMIDNKYSMVKSTAAEINQLQNRVKNSGMLTEPAEPKVTPGKSARTEADATPAKRTENTVSSLSQNEGRVNAGDMTAGINSKAQVADEKIRSTAFEPINPKKVTVADYQENAAPGDNNEKTLDNQVTTENKSDAGIELMFDSELGSMNNNDRILALHKEEKSNMAIAKELDLGVGEVKLVLDLFKN